MTKHIRLPALVGALLAAGAVQAEAPSDFLRRYEAEARQTASAFAASPARGRSFFQSAHGREWSCASCHTRDPTALGRHAATGKPIEPLAPAANTARFVRADKVEKWFRRNCRDVVGRECSAGEKSDVLAYLMASGK